MKIKISCVLSVYLYPVCQRGLLRKVRPCRDDKAAVDNFTISRTVGISKVSELKIEPNCRAEFILQLARVRRNIMTVHFRARPHSRSIFLARGHEVENKRESGARTCGETRYVTHQNGVSKSGSFEIIAFRSDIRSIFLLLDVLLDIGVTLRVMFILLFQLLFFLLIVCQQTRNSPSGNINSIYNTDAGNEARRKISPRKS